MLTTIKKIYEKFQLFAESELVVGGWVRSIRSSKQNIFVILNDGSTVDNLQLFFSEEFQEKEKIESLKIGSALKILGILQLTPTREQIFELIVKQVLNICLTSKQYPIQKKNLPFEFIRNYQQFRVRTKYFLTIFRLRSSVSYLIHKFFQKENFTYITTPLITVNDAEGGSESFFIRTSKKDNFFTSKANLTVSGQLQAEALAQGLGRVYNFSPCFRAENSNTTKHLAEFWMIEAEVSFCSLSQIMKIIERMIKYVIKQLLQMNNRELQFFGELRKENIILRLELLLNKRFKVISYTKCVKILQKKNEEDPNYFVSEKIAWGSDLSSEHEKYITSYFEGPVFVNNYPSKLKAFYMKENNDKKTVACVDLLFPIVGELVGGSSREESYEKLVERANLQKLNTKKLGWYFELRKNGYSPSAGFGLGLERFLMFITGSQNIRDTIPFPRAAGELKF